MANFYEISQPTAHRGIRQIDGNTWLVRARVRDPLSGKEVQRQETFEGTLAQALRRQVELKEEAQAGPSRRQRFAEFAALLLERKVQLGDVSTAKGLERWQDTLEHHLIPEWGRYWMDDIRARHIKEWLRKVAGSKWERRKPDGTLIASGEYSPNTVNGWLRILLTILREARADFEWGYDPTFGVDPLDTSTHRTYTSEEPNSLTPEEVPGFFKTAHQLYPQHVPFLLLGVSTGRRPSELRPLRRSGESPDILWDEGVMLVRRSHAGGQVSEKTKTGLDLEIGLPDELIQFLRLHAAGLMGDARRSDLLFPSEDGGYHSPSFLDKPLRRICETAGIRKTLTPRFMRRTWQDMCRREGIRQVVAQSVCGHLTDGMTARYSTVSRGEQREAVGSVVGKVLPFLKAAA